MRRLLPGIFLLSALVLAPFLALRWPGAGATPGATTRVSVDSNGNEANHMSGMPAISADGRHVAFVSYASNLVPGDTHWNFDVFVHDRKTAITERVSVDSHGNETTKDCQRPATSADGRYVAFDSWANLVPEDTNFWPDVFVRDRETGTTERVSVDSEGFQGDRMSLGASLSADGRYVAFSSVAGSLVSDDTNNKWDVFVHDRQTGATERVSEDSYRNEANNDSWSVSITAHGQYVAFASSAGNLVPYDTNDQSDVFVHDRETGVTERVSVDSNGTEANGDSGVTSSTSISADGRYVAFSSAATNLVPGDANQRADVFVRDRQTGATERVSLNSFRGEANGDSDRAAISAGGRCVAFVSDASNLVIGDHNGLRDVFVHDRQVATTQRVSTDGAGGEANGFSEDAAISADCRYVTFSSRATNLVPGDTSQQPDVFVHLVEPPVGGIVEVLSSDRGSPERRAEDSGPSALGRVAPAVAAALLALTAAAWYARRRWLTRP